MMSERRIKVDFPSCDITPDDISSHYMEFGADMVQSGEVPDVDSFIKNLEEYNRLQYKLMDKTASLCESMEAMLDNDFVIINDLNPIFEEVDRITERMEDMKYFIPRDEVLEVLERYLSLHQRLFDKPVFYVESGWDVIQDYGL
ncbi:DUF5376 family protein [Methanocella conradii]|uniref:DUF5376 family protein n=1 Tax=Methanocella conradii TaxID=1175444 RepID=UPI00157D3620|nr:DUF5376 family protein [Methanocella conradii]